MNEENKSKYSEGPWKAEHTGCGWEIVGPNGNRLNVYLRETFSKEDALLMAASLEMLGVLRILVGNGMIKRGQVQVDNKIVGLSYLAEKAIAKAEGREG